jgi:transcriptional regulator of aromatic amino acid metabolism
VLERAQKSPETCQRFVREGPNGRLEPRISARLVDYLVRQPLPDNVRELRRVLLRAINASDGDEIRMPAGDSTATGPSAGPPGIAPVYRTRAGAGG